MGKKELVVRYGYTLTPMLYVLCAEPLFGAIWQNLSVQGIPLPDDTVRDTVKVTWYTDLSTSFVSTE